MQEGEARWNLKEQAVLTTARSRERFLRDYALNDYQSCL